MHGIHTSSAFCARFANYMVRKTKNAEKLLIPELYKCIDSIHLDILHEHANENEEPEPRAATVLLISNRRSGRQRVFGNHQLESLHLVDTGQSKSLQLWGASIAREVISNAFRTENR